MDRREEAPVNTPTSMIMTMDNTPSSSAENIDQVNTGYIEYNAEVPYKSKSKSARTARFLTHPVCTISMGIAGLIFGFALNIWNTNQAFNQWLYIFGELYMKALSSLVFPQVF